MKKKQKLIPFISLFLGFSPLTLTALHYEVLPLVADQNNMAPNMDAKLINPWGLFFVSNGNFWVSDNGTNVSTAYHPDGSLVNFVVNVPSFPTGAKFDPNSQFVLKNMTKTDFANFLFSTEDGKILGFNNTLDPTKALVVVDHSSQGSVYKGLEIVNSCCLQTLFAADFHNSKIDVFDHFFKLQFSLDGHPISFPPFIPSGYAPFNIRTIHNLVYVTYAKQKGPDNHDDDAGPGNGFVNIYFPNGEFFKQLIARGHLNSPWGLALAPSNFGEFSGALLVGNFGDGMINAYHPITGQFLGHLTDAKGTPIAIDGLWSLEFDSHGTLYFTSGPNDESNGLVGVIRPLP